MAETDSPKLQKLRRKLSELQKQGAKEEVERLQRKIAKLERKASSADGEAAAADSDGVEQQQAEEVVVKQSKKDKKAKRKAEEASEQQQPAEEAVAAEDTKPSKKAKKEGKAVNGHAANGAAAATNGHAQDVDQQSNGAGKKSKKEKRKAAEEDNAEEEEQPKQSNKKSSGSKQASGSIDLTAHASVGNAELARKGKTIVKALYKEHPEVAAMGADKVSSLREQKATTVEGQGTESPTSFKPLLKFEHTGLPPNMLHATREFTTPSPIQSQCWPIVLSGRDLIGIAATGSGKTLAFGLPMLAHIKAQRDAGVVGKSGKGPFAIVMAPTRELALQINQVIHDAGSKCGVRTVCVYGGVPKKEQVDALKRGVEVVVGTPGRLEDLMGEGACVLHEVTYLVLDEADRMLDLGFEPHIRQICSTIRSDRQTLMFSATWPTAVQKLAANFLSTPVKVTIGSQDLAASHTITQHVEVIDPQARDERLLQLLSKHHSSRKNRIIIFVLYKKEAPRVEALLNRKGWKCAAIHGDISQGQRTAAVEAFKAGTTPLLIATDVAARGLDIPDVEVVINYSFPLTTEDYVHRIGRTGRAGKSGLAFTFFCAAQDKPRAGELINVLREANQKVPDELLKFGTAVKKKESKLYGAHFKDVDITAKASKVTFDDDD